MLGFESIISGGLMLIVYSVMIAAVYKIFQMSNDVGEMKQLLRDIKRNTAREAPSAAPLAPEPQSPEALVRAVHSASYDLDEALNDVSPRTQA